MILWMLKKRQRRYFYLIFIVVILDLYIAPKVIAWEIDLLRQVIA